MLSRYGSGYTAVIEMEITEATELINYALKQRIEEILMKRWITNYEKDMSLAEFKQKLGISSHAEDRKVEDILLELKEVFG